MSETLKECADCGQQFAIIPLEQKILEKLKLPQPTNCPFCRKKRRHRVRMRGCFYKVKCAKCGKEIHTTCDPETGLLIYCKDCYLAFKGSGEADKIFLDL